MFTSPKFQSIMMAILLAIMAPGAVEVADGYVHNATNLASTAVAVTANSTSQRTPEQMDVLIDRVIDRVLGQK